MWFFKSTGGFTMYNISQELRGYKSIVYRLSTARLDVGCTELSKNVCCALLYINGCLCDLVSVDFKSNLSVLKVYRSL